MLLQAVKNLLKRTQSQQISDTGNQGNIHQAGRDILVLNTPAAVHATPPKIKKTFTIDELFLKKKGSETNARDILLFRAGHNANFNENFYLERKDVDTTLSRNAFYKRHSLIIGKPLSGKSRAIYELVKRDLQEYHVYIPKDFACGDDADIEITFDIQHDRVYFLICDLHDFLKKAAGISILKRILLQENAVVIADCRKERFDFVSDNMAELLELFTLINIKGISSEIRQRLKFSLKEHFKEGDDTIGSYFLDITAMRMFHQKELVYEEKEILRSYKALHHLWGQKLIAKADIIDYTSRRFEKHYNKRADIPLAGWDAWFQTLVKYGFVKLEGHFLLSEETYLENIIASDEKTGIFQDEVIAFYPNIQTFNQLLHNAELFYEVNKILKKLHASGIGLELSTYTILLSKCESVVEAEEIFDKMQREGIRPDLFAYNIFLSKCEFYEDGLELFNEMRRNDIVPNHFTCGMLLLKCTSFGQAENVFRIMREHDLKPGLLEYTRLLSRSPSYDVAISIFEDMISEGLEPDLFTYNALISRCTNYRLAAGILEDMKKKDIHADLVIYNTLMSKCRSCDQGEAVLAALKRDDITPDFSTYDGLLSVCESLDQIRRVFDEMRFYGLHPDNYMYRKAISVLNTYADGNVLLHYMEQDGQQPSYIIYNALMSKKVVFTEPLAEQLLERLKRHGLSPTTRMCRQLISKSGSFEEAIKIFQRLRSQDAPIREFHALNTSLNKCRDSRQAAELLMDMIDKGIKVESSVYNRVLNFIDLPYDDLLNFGLLVRKLGLSLNTSFYRRLILRCISEKPAIDPNIFCLVEQEGAGTREESYRKLFRKCRSGGEISALVRYFNEHHIILDARIFHNLFRRLNSFSDLMVLLEQMQSNGQTAGNKTYAFLFSRAHSLAERHALLENMINSRLRVNSRLLNKLIMTSSTFEEAFDIFKRTIDKGTAVFYETYNCLMIKSKVFAQAESVALECLKYEYRPEVSFYFHFMEKCTTFTELCRVLTVVDDLGFMLEPRRFYSQILYARSYVEAKLLFERRKLRPRGITRRIYHTLLLKCPSSVEMKEIFNAMKHLGYAP